MKKSPKCSQKVLFFLIIGFFCGIGASGVALAELEDQTNCFNQAIWGSGCKPQEKKAVYEAPVYTSTPAKTEVKAGTGIASIAYPTGRKDNSVLWIEKHYPLIVKLNKPYSYIIKVTNLTSLDVPNVVISEHVPAGFTVQSSDPASTPSGGKMQWDLGKFNPRETKVITVTGMAESKEALPCCTGATYDAPTLCVETSVVQPELELDLTAASEVTACETVPLNLVVTNPGDGAINNVKITTQLPDGLEVGGKSEFTINVGSLVGGASKKYSETARPTKVGTHVITANATASDELSATATAVTSVVKPNLTVSANADREKQFVGRDVNYTVTISNNGNATAESTVLSASLSGARAKGSDRWDIGTLAVGASKTVNVEATAMDAGQVELRVMAEAVCSDNAKASASTNIMGIPAILLEVIDVVDPVEVGNQETYEIRVTNQGSAPDSNIKIVATLDKSEEYVSSSGPTHGSVSGNTVTFAPLAKIDAQDSVTWKVVVKGTVVADARFKVTLDSDQLTKNVEETEATNIY